MNGQNEKVGQGFGARHEPPQGLRPGRVARLAWLPIPLLLAAIIVARAAGLTQSYMSEDLRLVLSVTFYTLVSIGTLFLIGRSFLASGTPGLLFLECGVILWSLAGTVGDAVSHGDANVNATIFNTGIFLSGLCHLAGAILSLRPQRALRAPPPWLGAGFAFSLVSLWLVAHAALAGWLPVFFIPGHGGTLVRYCVLISAIAMFVLSAGLLLAGKREARAPFTVWYALAMLLLAVGLFGIMIQLSFGSAVNWLARTAQWLGGFYLLLAAVAALRESDLPLFQPEEKSLSERYRYGVAIAIIVTATAVRFALSPALGMSSPFLTFYPAVILAALYGGLRAGLLATALSALIADYFWMEPVGQFAIGSTRDWVTILLFLLSSTMISFVIEAMHKARARLVLHQDHLEELVKHRTVTLEREVVERKRAEDEVRKSRDELEQRVQERTEDLRRQAEALSTSEKEFRLLAEAMPQIVWITDADGLNIYFNQQWVDYTGLTLEESYGHGWNKPFHPDDRQRAWDAWQNVVTNNGTYSLECRLRAVDGTYRWWLVRGVPVANEKGETTKWFGTCTDIEEFKKVEAQLRQAQKMEAVGTLAGGIAHDFNNMLTAIIGNAELAMDDVPEEMTVRHNLDQIFKAGMRARGLVRQILTFSRKTEQEHKPLALTPLVNETFKLLRSSLPTIIEMRLNIETESDVVLADPIQMQQILMNLCTNAGDAMRAAGGRLDLSLSDTVFGEGDPLPETGMQPGTYVTLTVSDMGLGMHEDVKTRIFEPFFTTKERGQGTGMGLAVVYGIVKSHQGAITVASQPGQGATFTVYLPLYTSTEKTDEPASRPIPTGKERILFVDDEEFLVEMAEGMLERLGYKVVGTTDSVDALHTFAKDPGAFDLVITDHTMPQMTGATLAQKLKEARSDIPIILCTGYSETISQEKAQSMGIDGFVMKPLSRNELGEVVRRVLDKKAQA